MKVLIVDDNREVASIIQKMLEAEGHEVKSVSDGRDGYSAFFLFKPDLVITDLHMPRENGLELMKHIRVHDPAVRTVYVSGDMGRFWLQLDEEKKRYPVSLLRKPFSRVELMRSISELQVN